MRFRPIFPRAKVFGFDWLGRAFATVTTRNEQGLPGVALFEPGTGQVLEVPCNVLTFHNEELIDYKDAALAETGHRTWLERGGTAPSNVQCVGYRKPLFLGGVDEIDNMEIVDLEVYWSLLGQILAQVGHPGRRSN